MPSRSSIPENIPVQVKQAISVFADDELAKMTAFFDETTGLFETIGFIGPDGLVTQWAEPKKAEAIKIVEDQMRLELSFLPKRIYPRPYNGISWINYAPPSNHP